MDGDLLFCVEVGMGVEGVVCCYELIVECGYVGW